MKAGNSAPGAARASIELYDRVGRQMAGAAALIERSAAPTLAPAFSERRAELAAVLGDDATRERLLREARHLYEEISVPGHAVRLEKETAP